MAKGKFISFEGGEGSGKSTQSALLFEFLESEQLHVIHTREPGGTEEAEAIRRLLVSGHANFDGISEALLIGAARRHHLYTKIQPALEAGCWVICDRFTDSTIAYQGFGHQTHIGQLSLISQNAIGSFEPDLTILLDIDPATGLKRSLERSNTETRFEQLDLAFHQRVREGFLTLEKAYPNRIKRFDATENIESTQQLIRTVIQQHLLF